MGVRSSTRPGRVSDGQQAEGVAFGPRCADRQPGQLAVVGQGSRQRGVAVDLRRAEGDRRRRQAHAEQERAGVDVARPVHTVGVFPYGWAQPEREGEMVFAEAQVLLPGEGRVDVGQEAVDQAL